VFEEDTRAVAGFASGELPLENVEYRNPLEGYRWFGQDAPVVDISNPDKKGRMTDP